MKDEQRGIRAGLVDFSDPTFLLIGDTHSFNWLAGELEAFHAVVLKSDPRSEIDRLLLLPSVGNGRCLRLGPQIVWQMSVQEAETVAAQLRVLAAASSPGHHYLDPDLAMAGLQIVASVGEYDPEVFAEDQ